MFLNADLPAIQSPSLAWLPVPPPLTEALQDVGLAADWAAWLKLVSLANTRLDSLATLRLDRRLVRLFGQTPPHWLETKPIRLAVLASSTVDHLLPSIRIGALRRGLWVTAYLGDYGQYLTEMLDPTSGLHAFGPDAILFALDAHHLIGAGMDASGVKDRAGELGKKIAGNWKLGQERFGCKIIQQTIVPAFAPLFGGNEHRLPHSPAFLIDRINEHLRELADGRGADLLVLGPRILQDGLAAWHDPVLWHRAKQEIHPSAGPVYGDLLARLFAAQQGRSFKCLVLDLDNTLWGGVIGDDGLEGITLGQGSALGEAYASFQRYAQDLGQRGIVLAVCSKNDEANALEPFDKHPEMVLRRSDIACFAANWTDKAANLREIASRLNVGLDSLVFVDDNPFERAIVRQELPMVAVPELPEDPAFYANCLANAGYFESIRLTEEDLERTQQYQANLQRAGLQASATNLEGYLRSLQMELRWKPFDEVGLRRIVQLINKTNQFNLTTRRVTEDQICKVLHDREILSLQLRLVDQFGDNGIIAIVIGRLEPDAATMRIETWLMSCRVLGRQVEEATLNLLVERARVAGAVRLVGEYIPTAKNGMVRDLYGRLGFKPLNDGMEGTTRWELLLGDFAPRPTFITTIQA